MWGARPLLVTAALLQGCTNYISPPSYDAVEQIKLADVRTYQDGRQYTVAMQSRLETHINDSRAVENLSRFGIIGGGIAVLAGVIGRAHPDVALIGTAVSGSSYIYGQTSGSRPILRVYLEGIRALNCVLEKGTRSYRPLRQLGSHAANIESAAENLETILDLLEHEATLNSEEHFIRIQRRNVNKARQTISIWRSFEADLAESMFNASNSILASVNKLAEEREPTLDSLYRAADLVGAITKGPVPEPKENDPVPPSQPSLSSLTGSQAMTEHQEKVAALKQEAVLAERRLGEAITDARDNINFQSTNYVELDNDKTCSVVGEAEATLHFNPSSITIKRGEKVGFLVSGGRPPYTWTPIGALPSGLSIEGTSTTAISGTFTITATTNATLGSTQVAFGSLHPKAEPQMLKITIIE